jgi:hypothetical protein
VLVVAGSAGLIAPLACRAQAQASWADSLFSENGVNFGAVARGAKVRHNFVLTNRLNEPVTILNVRASCGCTTGQASTDQVPPGGQAVIEAQMDTRNFVGNKSTTLAVLMITASGQQAEKRFTVVSNILSDIVINPGSVDLGVVARGQTPGQLVTIERVGAPTWQVSRMIASEAFCKIVDAKLEQSYRNAQGVGYNLTVTLRADAPAGLVRDEIRLVTNDPQNPAVPVLVTAQVQGSLSASPSQLNLGAVVSAGGASGRYIVRAARPFSITKIEGQGDGFTLAAPTDPSPKAMHVLTLSYKPEQGSMRGDLKRTFQVATDLPGEPPLVLTATARVAP